MSRTSSDAHSKQATNVSIRKDLLAAARASGLNLSATLERALAEELAKTLRQKWLDENRAAIDAYNAHIEQEGVFSDGLRSF